MVAIRPIVLISSFLCSSVVAMAADVTGTWTARLPSPPLWDSWSFNFNVERDKLTGTVFAGQRALAITDGKISGEWITFTLKRFYGAESVEQKYTGTVSGGVINFKREGQFRSLPIARASTDIHARRIWVPILEFTAERGLACLSQFAGVAAGKSFRISDGV